jgi:hypothetical protein
MDTLKDPQLTPARQAYSLVSTVAILLTFIVVALALFIMLYDQMRAISWLQLIGGMGVVVIVISAGRYVVARERLKNIRTTDQSQSDQPVAQGNKDFRKGWPIWMKQLPLWEFPSPDPTFQLINQEQLQAILKDADEVAKARIQDDIAFLDHELMRLFRERDYDAKFQQNRYRMYQIGYMVLSAAATVVGAFLALALDDNPGLVPYLGFIETVIALMTTYLATISGREAPLPLWLTNRRKAEHLRREYFRYLMDLSPYDELEGYERRRRLSLRAADINRGVFPDANVEGQA